MRVPYGGGPTLASAETEPLPAVLIVDDQVDVARVVQILASTALNCETLVVHAGEDALALLREKAVDLVILDHHMPGMSGLQVLQRLRDDAVPPDAPCVVFFSADRLAGAEALRLGAVAVLEKPAGAEQLITVMRAHLGCA